MRARIAEVIRRFQENWRHVLDDQAVFAAYRDANYSWRERKLSSILTVRLFLLQIGFPIAHCLALVHYGSGLMQQVLTAPWRTRDLAQAAQLHPALEPGDVLRGDRGFCSFAHLALLMNRQVHAIFRVHQRVLVDFTAQRPSRGAHRGPSKASAKAPLSRRLQSLGRWDQLVQWLEPTARPTWLSAEAYALLPPTLTGVATRRCGKKF